MNILRSAWKTVSSHRMAVKRTFVVMVRAPMLARLAERRRRRAIADLESLPRAILRDLGIRREEIPIVVARAAQAEKDSGAGGNDPGLPSRDATYPAASADEPASRSKVA